MREGRGGITGENCAGGGDGHDAHAASRRGQAAPSRVMARCATRVVIEAESHLFQLMPQALGHAMSRSW
jgi:hypothetical protein